MPTVPRHLAEQVARQHLEARGFRFVTGNHSERGGELDLMMQDGDVLLSGNPQQFELQQLEVIL